MNKIFAAIIMGALGAIAFIGFYIIMVIVITTQPFELIALLGFLVITAILSVFVYYGILT